MRILMINVVCETGSTGRICSDLANILEKRGHVVRIAYGRNISDDPRAVRIGNDIDIYFHVLKSRLQDRHGLGSKAATKRFVQWIKDFNPDLIHLHNIHGYYINYEVLFQYLKDSGKPVIWTLHDCWAFTGHCSHYAMARCVQWKNKCSKCNLIKDYPASLGFSNVENNYEKKRNAFLGLKNLVLVTPSKWLAHEVKQSFLKEYPIRIIYNGIDLDVFKPTQSSFREKYGLSNKKIILGVSNVWNDSKGLDEFISLASIIDDCYQIVLVGVTEKQAKCLPTNILPIKRTRNIKELVEIYSSADVFVNPSRQETMGMVTLEALSCGTPVITYSLTAVPEVADESCGCVVHESVSEIYKKIKNMDFDYKVCVKRAKEFEINQQYLKYLDLYQNMVEI